jgi:hypothetical protein
MKICGYCKASLSGSKYAHEQRCDQNPENQPSIPVLHACGHTGERKRFDDDPDGAKAQAFEAERPCVECSIANYRRAQEERTPEQEAELAYARRAAFGVGVRVVDVLTGREYTT